MPDEPGRYVRSNITVDYVWQGEPHRITIPALGLLCVETPKPCEWTPADDDLLRG